MIRQRVVLRTAAARIQRIAEEIDQYLFQPQIIAIGHEIRMIERRIKALTRAGLGIDHRQIHLHTLQALLQQRQHIAQSARQRRPRAAWPRPANEKLELIRDLAHAFRERGNRLKIFARRGVIATLQKHARVVRETTQRRQRLIQFMRDTRSHLA